MAERVHSDPRPAHATNPAAELSGMYMLALAAAGGGNLLIRVGAEAGWLGGSLQLAIGVLAVLPLAWMAFRFWRVLRGSLDEMLQRIVLEGFAFALVLLIPITALVVNLRTAGAWTPRLDPPDFLLIPAVLVGIGIALAFRRYE